MSTAAILTIGTELTRGELNDTNGAWLAEQLTAQGIQVDSITSVSDDASAIIEAILRLSSKHELLLCTGGLGPTSDDLTAACVARAAGVPLIRHPEVIRHIQQRFARFQRRMPAMNVKQADIPSGCEVLENPAGTAPGFACRIGSSLVVSMPGVPREVQGLWKHHVSKLVSPLVSEPSFQTNLLLFGAPESEIAERLGDVEQEVPGVTVAYRASAPKIEVKFLARAETRDQARHLAQRARDLATSRLGELVFGQGSDSFVSSVATCLRAHGMSLAVAESCTGGLISSMITSEPASDYFVGAVTTYANEAKERLLGVPHDVLEKHGAVSSEVATAMAEGVRHALDADLGVGVTGIAGPTGGTENKPVGLVYWAASDGRRTVVQHQVFPGNRTRIQAWAAYAALSLARKLCREHELSDQ